MVIIMVTRIHDDHETSPCVTMNVGDTTHQPLWKLNWPDTKSKSIAGESGKSFRNTWWDTNSEIIAGESEFIAG